MNLEIVSDGMDHPLEAFVKVSSRPYNRNLVKIQNTHIYSENHYITHKHRRAHRNRQIYK